MLSNQPQGGFLVRKPSPVVSVARSDDLFGNGFGFNRGRDWDAQYGNTPRGNTLQRGGQYDDQRQGGQYYYDRQQGSW